MEGFLYPLEIHHRRHGPIGYLQASGYRPWLRDEFSFRCIYCLLREAWGLLRGTFDIDHFLPVATHPEQALNYDNLVYAGATCNAAKSSRSLPNPESALVAGDIWVNDYGTIATRTPAAERLVRVLGLDSPEYNEFRLLWIGIIALAKRHAPTLYQKYLAIPIHYLTCVGCNPLRETAVPKA